MKMRKVELERGSLALPKSNSIYNFPTNKVNVITEIEYWSPLLVQNDILLHGALVSEFYTAIGACAAAG